MSGALSLHHFQLWALDPGPGRHHPCGFPPKGDFMLQLWAQRWACCRVYLGEETCRALTMAPFLPSDAGDMIEMQGFGPSLPAWHLEPLCSQDSSCLSYSTSSSPYVPPSHCSCVPDR